MYFSQKNSLHSILETEELFCFVRYLLSCVTPSGTNSLVSGFRGWKEVIKLVYSLRFRYPNDMLLIEQTSEFYTVKPVCNDHLHNKIYYLGFIQ